MEIPVINFEASISSLNNPSLISRVFSLLEFGKLSYANRIWKWGALFLALVYALSSLVHKFKIIFFYFHYKSRSLLASSEPLLSHLYDEFDSSDDENGDDCSASGSSSDDDAEEEMEDVWDTSFYEDDDFNVKGSFCNFSDSPRQKGKFKLLRRRRSLVDNFSLSELVNGNGVVKLWDGFELGVVDVNNAFSFLDFDNKNYDCAKGSMVTSSGSFFGGSTSPAVFVSAGNGGGKMGLAVWDLRCGGGSPAVHSEWRADRNGRIIGMDSGRTGKVFVRDDVTKGLAVGDVRKADVPLTEQCEEEMWRDADE